ncbi:MAG: hypothetical protein PHQ90_07995 [Sulfuricurvum sp.]|uniref:hypothetical protein n=1 Tax=Sulfuricurvum sp. TaxID=2025608 RepID=UPI0026383C1B|nr:hypothetical protein [Sulfuricurvum sp.]MDD2369227.1 hypothetical protein [Sulfuricurvum sp.]MDD2949262.1 hypothetical protein [Sulfuricurvum sp.]MDD5117183.1 hypothetical protein [Sulfuricurvum sp.]
MKLLLALVAIVIFAGCSTQSDEFPYPLVISEEGLGSIHPNVPFEEVNTRLNGFSFDKFTQISPEHPESIYQIKRGKNVIAQISSDPSGKKISSIHIVSPLIKNKYHQGIGDILTPRADLVCKNDTCSYANEPSVHYALDPDGQTVREITFSRI